MGTNAYGMVKAAEQLGFTAKAVKGNQDAFFSEFPLPAAAHVIREGGLLHYVVIHKITKSKVVIADPAKGIIKISPEEFFKEWTGILILMVPAQTFKKGKETKNIFERFWGLLLPQKKLIFDVFLASMVIYGVLVLVFNKPYKKANEKQMEDNAQLTSYLVESLNSIPRQSVRHIERSGHKHFKGCTHQRRQLFGILPCGGFYRKQDSERQGRKPGASCGRYGGRGQNCDSEKEHYQVSVGKD